jgi:hypothetical protein
MLLVDMERGQAAWVTIIVAVIGATGAVLATKKGSGDKPPAPAPVPININVNPGPVSPIPAIRPEVSSDYFVGRWRSRFTGDTGAETEYDMDGTFSGSESQFRGNNGQRVQTHGNWLFSRLSNDTFRLTLRYTHPFPNSWQGTFRVIDDNRVHNVDEDYDAVRVR